MRIPATFSGAAARPVLYHAVDTLHAPTRLAARCILEGFTIRTGHITGKGRILAECAIEAAPAGIRGDIHLRRQSSSDSQGPVFGRYHLPVSADDIHVKGGGKPQFPGPLGDVALPRRVKLAILLGLIIVDVGGPVAVIAGVCTVIGRNPQTSRLAKRLHGIGPACPNGRRSHIAHQHVADVVIGQEPSCLVIQHRIVGIHCTGIQHEAADLLQCELRGQVPGPCLRILPPVLIHIQASISVQVFKGVTVHGQDGGRGISKGRTLALEDKCVLALLFHCYDIFVTASKENNQEKRQNIIPHNWSFL